jgi:CheY-like chemotaxis protein
MAARVILLVEDDPVQIRQYARVLRLAGYEVLQASTAMDALGILNERRIDLLLTDLKMPGMNGQSLVEHVKRHHPGIPVGVVTAYPGELGTPPPDGLLCKPFHEEELNQLVQELSATLEE